MRYLYVLSTTDIYINIECTFVQYIQDVNIFDIIVDNVSCRHDNGKRTQRQRNMFFAMTRKHLNKRMSESVSLQMWLCEYDARCTCYAYIFIFAQHSLRLFCFVLFCFCCCCHFQFWIDRSFRWVDGVCMCMC